MSEMEKSKFPSTKIIEFLTNISGDENSTVVSNSWREDIKFVLDYLMLLILVVVMLAMGCKMTWTSLSVHIKRPTGFCIGIFSQFGIVPLSGYLILKITGITGLHATGVLIISCCPGGVLSNTFTYFCDGDLSLSVAMTCASAAVAMLMMPFNLWFYGRSFESEDLVIPYRTMTMSLISVILPVMVGMLLKLKFPRLAILTTKLGNYCGLLIMFVCIVIEVVVFPNMFSSVPLKVYGVILTLPLVGFSLGFGLATLLRQSVPVRKTISIECGIQNVPVALTIVSLSFPLEVQEEIVLLPWLYGFAMLTGCSIMSIVYRFYKKWVLRKLEKEETESTLKKCIDDAEKDDSMNSKV